MDKEDLITLIAQGMSQHGIARARNTSQTNVRYFLKKYGLKTDSCRKYAIRRTKVYSGSLECTRCRETKSLDNFYQRKRKGLPAFHMMCKKCFSEEALIRQRELKQKVVDYKGGKCEQCGYNKVIGVLEFHHINPDEKDFCVAEGIRQHRDEKVLLQEVGKCKLLCANCHRELHHFIKEDKQKLTQDIKPYNPKSSLERQRRAKRIAVDYKGGKCESCGYDKYIGALEFHHTDPSKKDYEIASWTRSDTADDILFKELDKCKMLCANCHREINCAVKSEPEWN